MRAAVVGTNWGGVHVAALREAGVDVVALVGLDEARTRAAADRMGVAQVRTDPAGLRDLSLDLVSVATPPSTHFSVIDALPDLPVLCEKPAVGLSPIRRLPTSRQAPVWVNYAFAFLDVAGRAAREVDRIGPIEAALVVSRQDLPGLSSTGPQPFMELVPHPWSWVVTLLGPPAPVPAREAAQVTGWLSEPSDDVALTVRCGSVPVELACVHEPGLRGICHEVELIGAAGRIRLRGVYAQGHSWLFDPPVLTVGAAGREVLGEPELGPGDPWYRANARSIRAAVRAIEGAPASPLLFGWDAALALDHAVQSALPGR